MRTFVAYCNDLAVCGSLQNCINWGQCFLQNKGEAVVKIATARPGEDAKIIADVVCDGFIETPMGGGIIKYSHLRRALKNAQKEK